MRWAHEFPRDATWRSASREHGSSTGNSWNLLRREDTVRRARLHSYARVAQVSQYFAAITDTLNVSHPADISQGKIYATNLTFQVADGITTPTRIKSAYFFGTCVPPLQGNDWPASVKQDVVITDTPNNVPAGWRNRKAPSPPVDASSNTVSSVVMALFQPLAVRRIGPRRRIGDCP